MKKIREIVHKTFRSESVSGYLNVVSLFLTVSIFARIVGALIFLMERTSPDSFIISQLAGSYDDFIIIGYILLLHIPVYFILFRTLGRRSADSFSLIVLVFYLITELVLSWYFTLSMTPFSYQTIYGVSSEQAAQVAAIYGFEKAYLFFLIPVGLLLFFGLWMTKKIADRPRVKIPLSIVVIIVLITSCFIQIKPTHFDSELNYHSARNKIAYFVETYLIYQTEKNQFENINEDVELKKFYALNEINNKEYYDYPFFSEAEVRNPLGSFFPKNDSAPNVVFIICESLGKKFSGEEARLGSFTPFLDSLADHSLYWSNFMANAERTFGALPNILGGLPEGETGFMNLRYNSPDHLSIPQLLKENNGYQTAFFCGAAKEFDHMSEFMMTEKFDLIKSKPDFKVNPRKTEIEDHNGDKKQFNWGAEDKDVFAQSFDIMDSAFQNDKPYCNVYLTVSFHEPFNYSNEELFIQKARQRIDELKPPDKGSYLRAVKTFAALMYMDFALKQFMDEYQTRPEYENTIFVICGDHSIKFLGDDSRLEKFHVPLIIYSPMLKEPKRIKSMACQKDIPSAIHGLLRENFGLKLPQFAISQSDNLNTSEKFDVGNSSHVLMYTDRRMNSYVWKDYLYMEDVLYRIKDNLKIEQIEKPEILQRLKEKVENYRLMTRYVCDQNRCIPDSLLEIFSETKCIVKSNIDFETSEPETSIYPDFLISQDESFSGSKSLTNKNDPYLNLMKDAPLNTHKRVRLKLNFAIKVTQDNFPSIIIYRNGWLNNQKKEIDLKTYLLDDPKCSLIESKKAGWYIFECGYWFDKIESQFGVQKIGAFLFEKSGNQFFVDDLQIELREF